MGVWRLGRGKAGYQSEKERHCRGRVIQNTRDILKGENRKNLEQLIDRVQVMWGIMMVVATPCLHQKAGAIDTQSLAFSDHIRTVGV